MLNPIKEFAVSLEIDLFTLHITCNKHAEIFQHFVYMLNNHSMAVLSS